MKFVLALASIGALCLSAVQAIKITHKEWVPPCEEGDTQCWGKVGADCDIDDDTCQALALGVPEDELPDCQNGDDECWLGFWNDFFQPDESSSHKMTSKNGKAHKHQKNHKYNGFYDTGSGY